MRKTIFILPLIFAFISGFTQISTREIVINDIKKPIIYDSTNFYFNHNTSEEELKKYIGQKIYILPISKKDTTKLYYVFKYIPTPIYNYNQDAFNIEYDSFANHYLTILARIIHTQNYLHN